MEDLFARLKARDGSAEPPSSSTIKVTAEQQATNNLLNLLNIRAQPSPATQRATSSFAVTPTEPISLPVRTSSSSTIPAVEPSSTTQKYLLDLLTKPKTATTNIPDATSAQQTPKVEKFNYVNPFDQLHASSPLNGPVKSPTPQSIRPNMKPIPLRDSPFEGDAAGNSTKSVDAVDETAGSVPAMDKGTKSVAEQLSTVGEKVNQQVEKALAKEDSKDDVASSWSAVEDKAAEDELVEVFNFPMKPFVTLRFSREYKPRSFRAATWESSTPMARLKKDFSHDDRSLVTASQAHIVYSVPPTDKKSASGVKLIRQDDGQNKHLWSSRKERICNVQISSAEADTILATGLNGNIYYATVSDSDELQSISPDADGLVISPPKLDEPAQPTDLPSIRTRAKLSNRSSLFAASRGRSIHIFNPALARKFAASASDVDTDAYMTAHNATINIGKACKDFAFSEDDTVIATVDKLGRLKFWEVKSVIESSSSPTTEPLHSLPQAAALPKSNSKLSPSSVLFLDKERAHSKKVALRYVLLGFQQNHILQLWDLGLGRCVQELHLPDSLGEESEESNGVCSVIYHPKTSIIVIGNPGRNSVSFIHLSAPKYDLNPLSQSAYLAGIVKKDKTVPKPESTAIMTGIREFSFDRVGQLRSLDILKNPFQSEDDADEILFEVYAMHSKGVLGIPVSKHDLGWDTKGKVIKPVDGVEKGIVAVTELKEATSDEVSRLSSDAVVTEPPAASVQSISKAATPPVKPVVAATTKSALPAPSTIKSASLTPSTMKSAVPTPPAATVKPTKPAQKQVIPPVLPVEATAVKQKEVEPQVQTNSTSNGTHHADLESHFAQLYKKIENDRRIHDAASAAKQDAILRLVSSTLTENVESSLQRIIADKIRELVLPAVHEQVAQIFKNALPDMARDVRDLHTASKQLHSDIATSLSGMSTSEDVANVILRLEQNQADITVQLQSIQEEQAVLNRAFEAIKLPSALPEEEDLESPEVKHLKELFSNGKSEQATMEWLQSSQQAELFDHFFVTIDPNYLRDVSSLVALSVGAAVTASLESNIEKRLEWLATVVNDINVQDHEINNVAPKVFDVLTQRLQGTYMQLSESQPGNQEVLRKLASLTRLITATRKSFE